MSRFYKIDKDEKKLLDRATWRSGSVNCSFNFVKMMGQGYAYSMMPFINKYYKEEDNRREALVRANSFMNTNGAFLPFIIGINAAMEKKKSQDNGAVEESAIASVKTSLMGPLAGIGDSFMFNTLRVIAAGVGISLAAQGNVMGPIVFLALFIIPFLLIRKNMAYLGYTLGSTFLEKMFKSGLLKKVTKAASIVGIIMVGALVSQLVNIATPLSISIGESEVVIQEMLDSIMPGLLSVGLVFLLKSRIKKGVKPIVMVFAIMGICILGAAIGVL